MIDLRDLVLLDAEGEPAAVGGELLCFVEHCFTADAERLARLAARATAQGTRCRLVSVDSSAALGAFVTELALHLPVASDIDGALARRLGRWDDATFAARPGWAQVGRDGTVLTSGEGDLPRALLVFLGTAASHAASGSTHAAAPPEPRAKLPASGWLYLALSAGLVIVAVAVFISSGGRGGRSEDGGAPMSAAAPAAVSAVAPTIEEKRAKAGGAVKGPIGGGWYAVPPSLAGNLVRWVDGVVEVEGADLEKPPMACQENTVAMTGAVHVAGTWALDHVGTPKSKGARVGVRLLDERGVILPNGKVPGGSQVFVANGRLVQDWEPFSQVIPKNPDAAQVRLCVDNLGGTGVVRVKDVSLVVE